MQVLLLDRGAVSGGTTGVGEGNVLVCDKRPGAERELARDGRDLWLELGERFPAARVDRKGALLLDHPDGSAALELEPELAPGVQVLREPDDLQVDPVGLTRALADQVSVREDAAVSTIEQGSVTLDNGERLACEHVVVATGPWVGELTGLPVEPRKGQLVALAAPREPDSPQADRGRVHGRRGGERRAAGARRGGRADARRGRGPRGLEPRARGLRADRPRRGHRRRCSSARPASSQGCASCA